jgi:adenine/guanine/hypoxanthine permease
MGRIPFAVAPGLEINSFFAFVVVMQFGIPWQQALGIVFISGLVCVLLTVNRIRQLIIDSIPTGLKINISFCVGVFVIVIGLYLVKLINFTGGFPDLGGWDWNLLISKDAMILYVGLFISVVLNSKLLKFRGGILIAIIVSAVLCQILGIVVEAPETTMTDMLSTIGKLEFSGLMANPHVYSALLIFVIVDFFGGIGKFIGLTVNTNLQINGQLIGLRRGLYVDGLGTVFGAFMGTSSLICFVESAVGIAVGGRTGITAIVCGILMLASILLVPLVGYIPSRSNGRSVSLRWMVVATTSTN